MPLTRQPYSAASRRDGPPKPRSDVEDVHCGIGPEAFGQLLGGGAAAHVELVDRGEVGGLQIGRVLAGGAQAALDGRDNVGLLVVARHPFAHATCS